MALNQLTLLGLAGNCINCNKEFMEGEIVVILIVGKITLEPPFKQMNDYSVNHIHAGNCFTKYYDIRNTGK
jgi:hypothetical protein